MMTMEKTVRNRTSPNVLNNFREKFISAEEAASKIKSGDKIIVHSNCAFPLTVVNALVARKQELKDVTFYHALTVASVPYLKEGMDKHFNHVSFFLGKDGRDAFNMGLADFTPIMLSEIPFLFTKGIIPLDVALLHVSPPDEHGFCSYGVEVGLTKTGAERAKLIIAQVNKRMPRTLGNSFIHINKINYFVEVDEEIAELPQSQKDICPEVQEVYTKIGKNVADLIEDGATLQLGIGAIPDSVLEFLHDRRGLGVHTEMFSDGVMRLIERGVITNEMKSLHPGKVIAGFVLGSRELYDFIDNNAMFEFHLQEYVNDPFIIAKNSKMTAVNSAIEIDITGQVCSDSIGTRLFSGFGGQLDFIRGSARSEGGKPIIALPSSTKDGKISKIVKQLKPGAGVVTTRADVHYVVTEYGRVDLFGKSIKERVKALINIAHPAFREELTKYAREQKYI